jgi:hypothetical protein
MNDVFPKNDISGMSVKAPAPAATRRNSISGNPTGHKPNVNPISGNLDKPKRVEDELVTIYSHVSGEHLIKRRAVAADYIRCRPDEKWSYQKPVDREAVDRAIAEIESVQDQSQVDNAVKKLASTRLEELRAEARGLKVSVDPLWGVKRLKAEIDKARAKLAGTDEKQKAEGTDEEPPVDVDAENAKESGDEAPHAE